MAPRGRLLLIALLSIVAVWFVCSLARGDVFWPQPKSNTRRLDNFGLEIWVSRGQANPGNAIDVRFTVDNMGSRTEVIEWEDKPVMDIVVAKTYWSDGREITPEMRRLELAPGEARTIEMTWVVEGGTSYSADVVGILHGEHGDTTVRVPVCVGRCGLGY